MFYILVTWMAKNWWKGHGLLHYWKWYFELFAQEISNISLGGLSTNAKPKSILFLHLAELINILDPWFILTQFFPYPTLFSIRPRKIFVFLFLHYPPDPYLLSIPCTDVFPFLSLSLSSPSLTWEDLICSAAINTILFSCSVL